MSSESPSVQPVLIAGAGPVGLVLALSLLKNGVPVRIIDKAPGSRIGSRAPGIMPRTLEAFKMLGLADDIVKLARYVAPMTLYQPPEGVKVLKLIETEQRIDPTPTCLYTRAIILGQSSLEEVIIRALAKYSCEVEQAELVSFEQSTDFVTAHLVNCKEGKDVSEIAHFQYLVGTDGAHSVVRRQLGLAFIGDSRTEHMLVGDMCVEGLATDQWHMWGDATTAMTIIRPTEFDSVFNFILLGSNITPDSAKFVTDHEELKKVLRSVTGRNDLKFGDISWISYYTPSVRMVNEFGEGRVFVAGDAAHVHSPAGGQGMNSGIQDAFNLGWKLALAQKGLASASLLETYTEERRPVIAEVLSRSTALLKKSVESDVKNDDSGWKRGAQLLQLGINYRWSSIVVDEQSELWSPKEPIQAYTKLPDGKLRAGERAPDAPNLLDAVTGESTSLFSIFDPSCHIVLFLSDDPDQYSSVLSSLQSYPEGTIRSVVIQTATETVPPSQSSTVHPDFTLVDSKGHAHEAYDLSGGCFVVVVRPDGTVGAIVRGEDGLKRYFSGIFSV